uniref:Methyltransf_11 domain-containing protein n=1 Tax=Rhabditophanes sp. KR3021 TaxID=114890 RepID=A0AC35UCU0_9BILA
MNFFKNINNPTNITSTKVRFSEEEARNIEKEYVHNVYTQLAAHCSPINRSLPKSSLKGGKVIQWPVVKKFLREFDKGSILMDVGTGQCKYELDDGYIIGFDSCADILMKVEKRDNVDVFVADSFRIPLREKCMDGALVISVIHHFTTPIRRKEVLAAIAKVMKVNSRCFINAWAFEQKNSTFESEDVLVPFHINPTPFAKFHKDSTKEDRIIKSAIAINIPENNSTPQSGMTSWFNDKVYKYIPNSFNKNNRDNNEKTNGNNVIPKIPPAIPRIIEGLKKQSTTEQLFCNVKRWSPAIGRKLLSLVKSPKDQFVDELVDTILTGALTDVLSTFQEVTYYRYYHVFKKGELESLIDEVEGLKVVDSFYDSANWCCIAEKIR